MPHFLIEDIKLESISNFIKMGGTIQINDQKGINPTYSKYPIKIFIKAKRIGLNDFYYTKANILNYDENNQLTFQASLTLPGNDKNYKIWAEVFSEQFSVGTKSEELNLSVY